MANRAWNMPNRFRNIVQQFTRIFHGTSTEESRTITCANYVNTIMNLPVSKLYIDEHSHKDVRKETTEMINNIRNIFITMVNQSTWMDSTSKIIAIKKAQAITAKLGYPDYLEGDDMTKLDKAYAEYSFNLSYMPNVLSAIQLHSKANLQMLRYPIDNLLSSSPSNRTKESKAITNARRLYSSCIDENTIETEDVDVIMSMVSKDLGGWPVLQGSDWDESTFDFDRLMLKLSQYNNYIFYTVNTGVDETNSSIRNIHFDSSNYIRRLCLLANVSVMDTDIVIVTAPKLLHGISSIIDRQSPRTIQNDMRWHFMMNRAWNMPNRFRNIVQQFTRIFHGTSTEESRTITCANYVNTIMNLPVSKLYIDEHSYKDARKETTKMINNIRNIFITMINQSTWMDSTSKIIAIKKAQAITAKLGYPDYLEGDDMTKLDKDYAEYNFNLSYMPNVLSVLQLNSKANLQRLRYPIDNKGWNFITPTSVNAVHIFLWNEILFPAAIFQTPLFDKDAPKYLNYGGKDKFNEKKETGK
ncbi:unnamed protein product [Adineta steineri]|uniref:Peptidase M13 N-terminal domain-containing protein n=2 Tax=Adineta steineri TaxID=433720 RepID=A0A815NG80_9BILA|nr:unnamed protein product [Adineta steineri]